MSLQQKQNTQGGKLAGLFVRRPVLAVVINALIVVFGRLQPIVVTIATGAVF